MRIPIATLVLALVTSLANADDLPKGTPRVQLLLAKIEGEQLITSTSKPIPLTAEVVDKDGKVRPITVSETVVTITVRDLKQLRATTNENKVIPLETLKDRLESTTPVMLSYQALDATWKKKFKSNAIFIEYIEPSTTEKTGK